MDTPPPLDVRDKCLDVGWGALAQRQGWGTRRAVSQVEYRAMGM